MVDDDRELGELVAEKLELEGFSTRLCFDGERGASLAASGAFDFVLLDVMLPGIGGFEVLRRVRASSKVPVVMLTARGEEMDRVLGLELGADDYLAKPFSLRELAARLRAVGRRVGGVAASEKTVLEVGDVAMNIPARRATVGERELELTATEWKILETLLLNAGEVVSREVLSLEALGRPLLPYERGIDSHASNLRRKLGPNAAGSERFRTVRGVGYLFHR